MVKPYELVLVEINQLGKESSQVASTLADREEMPDNSDGNTLTSKKFTSKHKNADMSGILNPTAFSNQSVCTLCNLFFF